MSAQQFINGLENVIRPSANRPGGSRRFSAAAAALSGALAVLPPGGVFASDRVAEADEPSAPKSEWSVSARWENDILGGTDRFYTDGVTLGVSHTGPSWMDPIADWLPWGQGRRTVGYDMAQGMFTPADQDLVVPDPNDRPYAGILALGLTLHVEKDHSYHGLKFVTGAVGPASLAEETQDAVHDLVSAEKSYGWDSQLHNEPILNLAYEYRHKFELAGEREQWQVQVLPLVGGWLGNMLIQGQAGGFVRFSYNMPDDSGPTLVRGMGFMPPPRQDVARQSSDWGFSVYAGSVANLVLRDITLDGNTFKDSPSVDKEFFVPATGVGMSVGNQRFQTSLSYVFWGKEFEDQDDDYSNFGSLAVSYFY